MKTIGLCICGLAAGGLLRAAPVERAIMAAMRLSEVPSYSWRCSVMDDAQTYEIEGMKRADGCTWQRQPMPKLVARRLGRGDGDLLEAIFRDTHTYVIATDDGWKTLRELPKEHDHRAQDQWIYVSFPLGRTADMPADAADIDPFGLPPGIYLPVIRDDQEEDDNRAYSNAQFALALPHQELALIVSCHTSMTVEGDVVTGTLSDTGARLLLVHDGHEYIKPVIGAGRFKLWLHEGAVAKYTIELAGIVLVDRKTIYVRQKASTVLREVGTTTFELPLDAQRRLAVR